MIRKKEHKSIEGIYKLIGIKASLNKGLLEELKTSFPNVVSVEEFTKYKSDYLESYNPQKDFIDLYRSFSPNILTFYLLTIRAAPGQLS